MQVIWDRGPIAARAVVAAVNENRDVPVARNTVLKQMQRLEEKGWLGRASDARPASYVAKMGREAAERKMAASLRDTVFGGSSLALVRSLIGEGTLSEKEIGELRQLIDDANKKL